MQSEEAVEIDRAVGAAGLRDRDVGPRAIVLGLAERHDHVEAVNRAALEHDDQKLAALGAFRRDATDEARRESEAEQRHAALPKEDPSR